MKKKVLLIIFALLDISSNAQQLYFFRTNANIDQGEYQYTELPPTQIIAYTPDQDTLLHIYKDYTDNLPYSYNMTNIRRVEFYPEYNVFVLRLYTGFETYALYGSNPDTLIKMPIQCFEGYSVDPFLSMNIVNGQWAYQCYCNDKDAPKKDRDIAKGIDFSLSNHFDMSNSDFKDLYLSPRLRRKNDSV